MPYKTYIPQQSLTDKNGHSVFAGGVLWYLSENGLYTQSGNVFQIERTSGQPTTVKWIWEHYNADINHWCDVYVVPVSLIIATIATESGGNPKAERQEPGFVGYDKTPHRVSIGLMQTLISTAREALGDDDLSARQLLQPNKSIQAGVAYICQQHVKTMFDPPLVGAAYNAGSVYQQTGAGNRWKLRQYPIGSGKHLDRWVKWFNDATAMLQEHPVKPAVEYECPLQKN